MSEIFEGRMVTGGELANELSDAFPDMPTTKAREAFRSMVHTMQEALIRGDRIEIRGFGSFAPRFREGGIRRNPRSGEKVEDGGPLQDVHVIQAGEERFADALGGGARPGPGHLDPAPTHGSGHDPSHEADPTRLAPPLFQRGAQPSSAGAC